MKVRYCVLLITAVLVSGLSVFAQGTFVINDPTKEAVEAKLSKGDEAVFNTALPNVKRTINMGGAGSTSHSCIRSMANILSGRMFWPYPNALSETK